MTKQNNGTRSEW